MSVDYRGHLSTGYLSKVTNRIDGKRYNISTVRNARTKEWETFVYKQGLFGAFRPLLCVGAQDGKQAGWVHDRVEEIAEQHNPADWRDAKSALIYSDEYAVASEAGFFQKMLQAAGQ